MEYCYCWAGRSLAVHLQSAGHGEIGKISTPWTVRAQMLDPVEHGGWGCLRSMYDDLAASGFTGIDGIH